MGTVRKCHFVCLEAGDNKTTVTLIRKHPHPYSLPHQSYPSLSFFFSTKNQTLSLLVWSCVETQTASAAIFRNKKYTHTHAKLHPSMIILTPPGRLFCKISQTPLRSNPSAITQHVIVSFLHVVIRQYLIHIQSTL